MAGTSATLVVQDNHHLDGEVVNIAQLCSYNKVFAVPISHISLHNMTSDILEVSITTTLPSTGNSSTAAANNRMFIGSVTLNSLTFNITNPSLNNGTVYLWRFIVLG